MEGKKSEKLHIRLTEDIAREVRAIADLEHRPIQDQLRFLIVLGIQSARSGGKGNSDGMRRTLPPEAASRDMEQFALAPPIAAKRRSVTHRRTA